MMNDNIYHLYDYCCYKLIKSSLAPGGFNIAAFEKFCRRFMWYYSQDDNHEFLGFTISLKNSVFKMHLNFEDVSVEFRAPWINDLGALMSVIHDFDSKNEIYVSQLELSDLSKMAVQ